MTLRSLAAFPVPLVLCSVGLCQTAPSWSWSHTADWNSSTVGPGREVIRLLAGEITGQAQLDVLALGGPGGTGLLLLDAIESNGGMLLHPDVVRDFDIAPRSTPTGLDELVFVDATGLKTSEWAPGVGFVSNSVSVPALQPWALARKVRAGFIDAQAGRDYVGLAQNSRRLMYFGGTEWQTPDTGPRVHDIVLLDWQGNAELEIALLTQQALTILSPTGQTLANFPRAYVGGDWITSFRTGNGSRAGIAWLNQGPSPALVVWTNEGLAPALLDVTDAVALSSGDADGDGRGDLVLARLDPHAPRWMRNNGTTLAPSFTEASQALPVEPSGIPPPSGPGVAPLLTDLNNDGRADLLVSVGGTSVAALVFMPADFVYDEHPDPPNYVRVPPPGGLTESMGPVPGFFPYCEGYFGDLAVKATTATLEWSAYFDLVPEPATHLEVRLWQKSELGAYTDPDCLHQGFVALLGDLDKDFTFYAVKEIPTGQLALSDCWKRALWIEMRLVKATGTAPDVTIEQAWPMHTAVVLGDCDAVTGMLPSPPNPNYNLRMAGAVPAPGGCTGGLACTDGFDLAVCFPSSETTGVPMVTLRNRRPPPPGLPVTYPTQSAAGVVTQNSVP